MAAPICPAGKTNYSIEELVTPFSNNSLADTQLRTDENGVVLPDIMSRYIQSLVTAERLPSSPRLNNVISATDSGAFNPVTEFAAKMKMFVESLREEFCYYDSRYKVAMQKWVALVTDASYREDANITNADIQQYATIATQLNYKLNLLVQLTRAVSNYQYSQSKQKQEDIEALNKDFNSRYAATKGQMAQLSNLTSTEDLRKRMVGYTQEKARATDNLLSLYAFLNVVALGVLVYVYKS
jgi:hypothetical protein